MSMWLLGLAVCLAATLSAHTAEPTPRPNVVVNSDNGLDVLAGRITGRVLGVCLRPGMTDALVVRLLGTGDKPLLTGGVSGGVVFANRLFIRYGMSVSFLGDGAGALRVNAVTYAPLFK